MESPEPTRSLPIYELSDDADTEFPAEPMGARSKFWFKRDGVPWLFKHSRHPKNGQPSGEHWAEVVACILAERLGLPHAEYELARFKGEYGVVSRTFVKDHETLVHGNELLSAFNPRYPKPGMPSYTRCRQHTLDAVQHALSTNNISMPKDWNVPPGVTNAHQVFEGFLLLDNWISNTDRHHENWGVCDSVGSVHYTHLAPTFDHASSLGANLTDADREIRLISRDKNRTVGHYVSRAQSRFWPTSGSKALTLLDALTMWRQLSPTTAWLQRLGGITDAEIEAVVNSIPSAIASEPARRFALTMLNSNKERILGEL